MWGDNDPNIFLTAGDDGLCKVRQDSVALILPETERELELSWLGDIEQHKKDEC